MMRSCLLLIFVFAMNGMSFGQLEEPQVSCTGRFECADDDGIVVVGPITEMGYEGCILTHARIEQQHRPSENPCQNGVEVTYIAMNCVPYDPGGKAVSAAAGMVSDPCNWTVTLDYRFADGQRRGAEATGMSYAIAFAKAMATVCSTAQSGIYGNALPCTGRCFVTAPGATTRRKCIAPRCPIQLPGNCPQPACCTSSCQGSAPQTCCHAHSILPQRRACIFKRRR